MGTALIKFEQGVTTDIAGRALLGESGGDVVCSNYDNANIDEWSWRLVEVPSDSALDLGEFSTEEEGIFTPDVPGCYVVDLITTDTALQTAQDRRTFGVPDPVSGRLIPPTYGNRSNMNFGGQTEGYSPYAQEYFRAVDTNEAALAATNAAYQAADSALSSRVSVLEAMPSVATVANFAALSGLGANVLHAYVTSRRAHYVKTFGGWFRLAVADAGWLAQSTWYIDPASVTSSDDNDGATAATALSTWQELVERLGGTSRKILLTQSVTVHILSDLPEVLRGDITLEDGGSAGSATQLFVLGAVQSTLFSGTITNVQAEDTATGQEAQITVAGVGDWSTAGPGGTSLVGKRLRRTSDNAIFYILGRVSATVAAVGPGCVSNPLAFNVNPANVTLANGDAFVIEQLPQIRGFSMNCARGSTSTTGTNFMHGIWDSLWISGGAEYSKIMEGNGANQSSRNVLNRCIVNGSRSLVWAGQQIANLLASNVNGTQTSTQLTGPVKSSLLTCCSNIGGILVSADLTITISQKLTIRNALGFGLNMQSGSCAVVTNTVGIYNGSNHAVSMSSFARLSTTGIIHGSGNAGAGIAVASGALFSFSSAAKPTVKGSAPGTNDVNISGVNYDYATNVPKFVNGVGVVQT
jgi:hypothetical protein